MYKYCVKIAQILWKFEKKIFYRYSANMLILFIYCKTIRKILCRYYANTKNIVPILCQSCTNIVQISSKYCTIIEQILYNYCKNIVQQNVVWILCKILCKFCLNILKILYGKYYTNTVQMLYKYYTNTVQIFYKHCANIAQKLQRYCVIIVYYEYFANIV